MNFPHCNQIFIPMEMVVIKKKEVNNNKAKFISEACHILLLVKHTLEHVFETIN